MKKFRPALYTVRDSAKVRLLLALLLQSFDSLLASIDIPAKDKRWLGITSVSPPTYHLYETPRPSLFRNGIWKDYAARVRAVCARWRDSIDLSSGSRSYFRINHVGLTFNSINFGVNDISLLYRQLQEAQAERQDIIVYFDVAYEIFCGKEYENLSSHKRLLMSLFVNGMLPLFRTRSRFVRSASDWSTSSF